MNIIQIKLKCLNTPRSIVVGHNQDTLYKGVIDDYLLTFNVDDLQPKNSFWVSLDHSSDTEIKIEWITMFNLGKEKLLYLGELKTANDSYKSETILPGSTWTLAYTYPVFSWLHTTLTHGWLIANDKCILS